MSVDKVSAGAGVIGGAQTASSGAAPVKGADFASVLEAVSSDDKTIDLDALFEKAAEKYKVPVDLLRAVARAESGFDPNAKSGVGAMGIMQLMPSTAEGLGVTDPYDAGQSIMGGAKLLSQLLSRFDGDTSLALAAYNAGPGNVIKYGGIPPFKETQNYVKKVLAYCGEPVSAGSVTQSAAAAPSGINDLFQSTGFFSAFQAGNLDKKDIELLINLYQYSLQAKLLAASRLDDKTAGQDR